MLNLMWCWKDLVQKRGLHWWHSRAIMHSREVCMLSGGFESAESSSAEMDHTAAWSTWTSRPSPQRPQTWNYLLGQSWLNQNVRHRAVQAQRRTEGHTTYLSTFASRSCQTVAWSWPVVKGVAVDPVWHESVQECRFHGQTTIVQGWIPLLTGAHVA